MGSQFLVGPLSNRAFHHPDGNLWLRGNLPGHFIGSGHQLIVVDNLIDNTQTLGFFRVDPTRGPE